MHVKRAAYMAMVGGIVVFVIKVAAYLISNSVALLSDALESIINIAASGLMLFAVHISEKPPDKTHNYGHRRIEEISRLLEGILILAAAITIAYSASGRLFASAELFELNLAIGISMLATALNASLASLLSRVAKTNGSAALEGDSKHLLSDVASSGGVWMGLLIVQRTGWNTIDSILAFTVAVLISRMGIGLILKSSRSLMDQSCREEDEIKEILQRHGSLFADFHDLKTRRLGNQIYSELHLSVEGTLTVKDAQRLADHLEDELREQLPNIDLTIHVEPRKQANALL